MFDMQACRACLNTECRLETIDVSLKQIFVSLTGVEIKKGDRLPQYLCIECHTLVKKALAFRNKCRTADFAMKQIMTANNQVTLNSLYQIDRKKSNLVSSLGISRCRIESDIRPLDYKDFSSKEDVYLDIVETEGEELKSAEESEMEECLKSKDDSQDVVKLPASVSGKKGKSTLNIKTFHRTFSHATIKYVPLEQQLVNFHQRTQSEPFKSAMYKCAICVAVFDFYDSLLTHVNETHVFVSNGYACNICSWLFETELQLTIHKAHSHWYEYKSELCAHTHYTLEEHVKCCEKQRFKRNRGIGRLRSVAAAFDRASLPQSQLRASLQGVAPHRCRVCDMPFIDKQTLLIHVNKHTEKNYNSICDVCGVRFRQMQSLRNHLRQCHLYSYTCKYCSMVFMNRSLAWYHIAHDCTKCHLYKNASDANTLCTLCNKKCRSRALYLAHMNTAHYSQLYVHHCTVCGVPFKSLPDLVRHQVLAHKYIRISDPELCSSEWQCSECSVWFVNKRALETHIIKRGHGSADHIELACAMCKLLFDNESERDQHLEVCRYTRYPQKCIYCDHMLHNGQAYQSHYRKKHKGRYYVPANPYTRANSNAICELCGKTYPASRINIHLQQMHSAKRRTYSCERCQPSRNFSTPSRYVSHLLANHCGKPYHCTLCRSQFHIRRECRDHILKVHAPVRPYTCGECSRTFAHLDYLAEHSLQAHNIQLESEQYPQLSKKITGSKIAVYPDMKIDVSAIDKTLLSQIDIYFNDYMEENVRVIEQNDEYLIFAPIVDVAQKRKIKSEEDEAKKQKMVEECGGIHDTTNEDIKDLNEYSKVGDTLLDEAGNEYKVIIEDNILLQINAKTKEHVLIDGVLYKLEISET